MSAICCYSALMTGSSSRIARSTARVSSNVPERVLRFGGVPQKVHRLGEGGPHRHQGAANSPAHFHARPVMLVGAVEQGDQRSRVNENAAHVCALPATRRSAGPSLRTGSALRCRSNRCGARWRRTLSDASEERLATPRWHGAAHDGHRTSSASACGPNGSRAARSQDEAEGTAPCDTHSYYN